MTNIVTPATDAEKRPEAGNPAPGGADVRNQIERPKRRWPMRLLGAAASIVILLAIVTGGLLAMLSRGPMEVPFLSERVAVSLERQIGNGVDADVGRTLLERTPHGLALHVQDVIIKDQKGQTILRSPDAYFAFDPVRLLALSFVPRSIELKGITLRVSIAADGEVAFSAVDQAPPANGQNPEPAVQTRIGQGLAALAQLARQGSIGELAALRIEDATLLVDDRRAGRQMRFEQLSLQFESPEAGKAVAKGIVSQNGIAIPFALEVKASAESYAFALETSNVNDAVIASAIGLSELPLASNGQIAGRMQVTTDANGKLLGGDAKVTLQDGSVVVKGLDEKPFLIREAILQSRWTGGLTQIESASLSIRGDEYSLGVTGNVSLPSPSDPWFRFRGSGKDWTLVGLTPADPAITVDAVNMVVSVKDDGRQIVLDSMHMKGAQTDITLNGRFLRNSEGPGLEARAVLGAMPVRNAIRWWPRFLATPTRTFFANSVQQGRLTRLDITMALPSWKLTGTNTERPLPADALKLEATVEGVTAQITPGLPPMVGISGSGRMNARQAEGAASLARIDLRNGKNIPLSEGTFLLTGLETYSPKGTFGFRSQTPLENVAELLKAPALKDAFVTGVDLQSLKGQFDGRGKITLPLGVALTAKNISTEFAGKMTAVSLENAIGKDKLDNATLTVTSDATGFEVKGDGRWQNIPVGVSLERDAADGSSSAVLSFSLDEASLKRAGIDIGQPVTSPIPVKIKTLREQGAGLKANIEADLTRLAFDGLLPGFRKQAGRPAKLTFDATEKQGGYSLQNISLESGASTFKGSAEVGNGAITSARLSTFRLSPGDNTRLDYDRTATGRKITIRGNNFDARPFLKQAFGTGRPGSETNTRRTVTSPMEDTEIDLKTTLLTGFGGEVITSAELLSTRRNETLRQLSLTGKINGKKLQIRSKNATDSATPILVDVDDAGAFLRYIDLYTRMIGGDMNGEISAQGNRPMGVLLARNFILRDEPAIRRLVQQAPSSNPDQKEPARPASAGDARFSKMRLSFAIDGSKTTISDAVIFGPEIGLTFNGLIDSSRDRISMSGTFVPAYGLNNAFSQIPVLGGLLTGGRNEGLLGITFGVSGRASAPNVTVNPLSAITPGIFRKIFEFRNETSGSSVTPYTGAVGQSNN